MKLNQKVAQVLVVQGLSYSEIGKLFGVSRQRVHQILTEYASPQTKRVRLEKKDKARKVTTPKELKERHKVSVRKYQRNNILSINGKQIRVKKRPRPNNICELCSKTASRLDYHHWDNTKPELGIWLCRYCHKMVERIGKTLYDKYLELKASIVLTV